MICSKCWKIQKKEDKWHYIQFTKSKKIYGLCDKCYNLQDIQKILKEDPENVKDTTIVKYMIENNMIKL